MCHHGTSHDIFIQEISALTAEKILISLLWSLLGLSWFFLCVCVLWIGILQTAWPTYADNFHSFHYGFLCLHIYSIIYYNGQGHKMMYKPDTVFTCWRVEHFYAFFLKTVCFLFLSHCAWPEVGMLWKHYFFLFVCDDTHVLGQLVLRNQATKIPKFWI